MYAVRGYFKPESSFHTIVEWETICNEFLALQKNGFDVRGGTIDYSPQLIDLINKYFSYQLYIETDQFPDLTRKKVLDFIEDFVNHKVWSLKKDYNDYIVNIDNDRIAFFNSRGAIEPYLLLDEQFTMDTYGTVEEEVTTLHWTSKEGLINLIDSTKNGYKFSIFYLIILSIIPILLNFIFSSQFIIIFFIISTHFLAIFFTKGE